VIGLRARGNQRVSYFHATAFSELPQIGARLAAGIGIDWNTNERTEEVVSTLYSAGRAPAQSSATLTGEYKTAAPELNSIHLEMMPAFRPRETSMRMSESTRMVIS
jgi:hypothetical protein